MADQKNTVDNVQKIPGEGLFVSKSGGAMNVPFNWPLAQVNKHLLIWDETTVGNDEDIRGLRTYTVEDIPEGQVGAMEMHRVRRELIFTTKGRVLWTFEDLYGGKKEVEVSPTTVTINDKPARNCWGVVVPPYVMHTYAALEPSNLFIVANAIFHPADLIGMDEFKKMQGDMGAARAA